MRLNKTKLLFLMADLGLKQDDIAKSAGMTKGNLSTIINGKRCRPETAYRISKALGVTAAEIFDVD